jgi:hypothetical protein
MLLTNSINAGKSCSNQFKERMSGAETISSAVEEKPLPTEEIKYLTT